MGIQGADIRKCDMEIALTLLRDLLERKSYSNRESDASGQE